MRVTKPAWVEHKGERENRCPIYSLSVHPDGTRLATGGLDRKVKIWSTLPILDQAAEADEANHKLLCTMSEHTGSVLAVRWAHHGRFLASGSDDAVVMIWGLDPDGGGRLWGSDEVNVENWKPLTRLVGHQADVVDIAWSRDDSMLASTGLDSKVWIWDGQTFERIRRIDQHEGFVKGVCWDPVGNYLATQSDDKTVKIWDTDTWTLVQTVSEPFKNSGHATFFRRLSWSPDGAFIAASNAKNGPVFVAAVIEREGWASEISFVGHANTIQVAAFNPRLFFRTGDAPGRATASCMLALGADDFSISIWRNTLHKPIVVLHDIFGRNLMDLCWSNDGHQLYGCSEDGTVCAISFDPEELPELGEPDKTQLVLDEYEFRPQRKVNRPILSAPAPSISNGFGPSSTSSTQVNVLQPRKSKPGDNRRRVNLSKTGEREIQQPSRGTFAPPSAQPPQPSMSNGGMSAFDAPIQPFASSSQHQASTARMFQDAHMAFADGERETNMGEPSRGHKRKASLLSDIDRQPKGRMMSSAQTRAAIELREIRAPRVTLGGTSGGGSAGRTLPVPSVQTVVRAKPRDGTDETIYLEAHNATTAKGKNKVVYAQGGQDIWVDYVQSAVLAAGVSKSFSAVACEDGEVVCYSTAGIHLFRAKLDAPASEIAARGHMLLLITAGCRVHVFDTKARQAQAVFAPTSLSSLLDPPSSSSTPSRPLEITRVDIRPNGVPIVITSEPSAYAYDPSAHSWAPIITPFLLSGSHSTESRRASQVPPTRGPLAELEAEILSSWKGSEEGDKPEWWDEAMEMGYLENKLRAAALLESREEYKATLLRYAHVLGKEGFRARGEELVKDLIGPIYHHPKESGWVSTIVGYQKRDLAREVLASFARSTSLSGLAEQYQLTLKAVASEAKAMEE